MSIMPYLWAASLKGSTTVRDVTAQADVSFGDILDGMEYAVIGQAEFQYGRFFFLPDTLLLKLGADVSVSGSGTGQFGLFDANAEVKTSAEMLTYFQELIGGYRVYEQCLSEDGAAPRSLSLDILGGIRYYHIEAEVTASGNLTVVGPGGGLVTRKRSGVVEGADDWIDPVVGARVKYDLTERLNLALRGDVGGFDVGSDLSWSASALANYKLNGRWNMFGGYKVLDIDYHNGQSGMDAQMAGPIIGFQYNVSF